MHVSKNLAIDIDKLILSYPDKDNQTIPILDIAHFSLGQGELCSMIGASGAGKTSLLYILAGLTNQLGGAHLIYHHNHCIAKQKVAIILQDHGLLPWKTVWENIALGLVIRKYSIDEIENRVAVMIQKVSLQGLEDRYPHQLSGGQQQRVAIARALILEPELLLMDEPFSALDIFTRESLQRLLLDLYHERPFSMLLVTHNIEEAILLAQKIVVLDANPGKVIHEIKNPKAGDYHFRLTPAFYNLYSTLRQYLTPLAL
ncbi:MAG: transporter related protein [Chlamydiales bacterium]|jgi:NitT/TauT family transport system ATP-binding protein|nr:transporter related protein [Chlamydiales bacterium]